MLAYGQTGSGKTCTMGTSAGSGEVLTNEEKKKEPPCLIKHHVPQFTFITLFCLLATALSSIADIQVRTNRTSFWRPSITGVLDYSAAATIANCMPLVDGEL